MRRHLKRTGGMPSTPFPHGWLLAETAMVTGLSVQRESVVVGKKQNRYWTVALLPF